MAICNKFVCKLQTPNKKAVAPLVYQQYSSECLRTSVEHIHARWSILLLLCMLFQSLEMQSTTIWLTFQFQPVQPCFGINLMVSGILQPCLILFGHSDLRHCSCVPRQLLPHFIHTIPEYTGTMPKTTFPNGLGHDHGTLMFTLIK